MVADFEQSVTRVHAAETPSEKLVLLGQLLRSMVRGSAEVDPQWVDRVGRLTQKTLSGSTHVIDHRVLVLGQCTTAWLCTQLTAVGLLDRWVWAVQDGGYDNILQELMSLERTPSLPDQIVLVPWHQRLLGPDNRDGAQRIEDELEFWQCCWRRIQDLGKPRIVQVGYDWTCVGPLGVALSGGGSGDVGMVRALNQRLRQALPAGAYFLDLEQLSGSRGRATFYDARRYHWTKQPFSDLGLFDLALGIRAGIRAMVTGSKKVVVVDLDNTLWGGIVGEEGALGIELGESPAGEAFRTFQTYLKGLTSRGVLLAVCSKNNLEDAKAPFEQNPNMVLGLGDIAAFEASWDPKSVAIGRIATTLQLATSSFVFVDDNPAEREIVRQALPEVSVVQLASDPADYIASLGKEMWFESVALTDEDRQRAHQYNLERERKRSQPSNGSLEDYLRSLSMVGEIRDFEPADLPRIVQLIGKTNQFNLTTRRHGREFVERAAADRDTVTLSMRLTDRFGDYGLVAVLVAGPHPDQKDVLEIDTWLMSCRVIARTAERFFFNHFAREAIRRGYREMVGRYFPTRKNVLVRDLYRELGFEKTSVVEDQTETYHLALADWKPAMTYLTHPDQRENDPHKTAEAA